MPLTALTRAFRRSPLRLPTASAYALWAETYAPAPHNPLMRVEQRIVEPLIVAAAPRRALDVGAGTGRYLPVLADAGARTVVALDVSMAMLARQSGAAPRVCADSRWLPFGDGVFDLVLSSLAAGDLADLGAWAGEIARVLRPRGHFIYSDFHPSWARAGWRRTFTAGDGRRIEIPLHAHDLDAHLAALAPFEIRAIREPRLDPADRPAVGRRHRDQPVVIVCHAVKPGGGRVR